MTNAVPLLQLAAQHAGYNLSTGEIAGLCALAGAAVHMAHQAVAAYGRAGGYRGLVRFLKTGSTAQTLGEGTRPKGSPQQAQMPAMVGAPIAKGPLGV